jgi:hypothetical protein
MPGRRNLARERAQHDADAKFREFHALLVAQVPSYDRALIGRSEILRTLDGLGIKRPNGQRLSWRIVTKWRARDGLPILATHRQLGRYTSPAWSTSYALTAWLLSRWPGQRLFRVCFALPRPPSEASPRSA